MTRIIVLTGPPASGKSTVCSLFEDLGVPTIGTGDAVRAEAEHRYDNPTEDEIWEVAESLRDEHGPAGPTIACASLIKQEVLNGEPIIVISDLRHQEEVDWLEEMYGEILVIRVDTRNRSERVRRYIDREVGNLHEHGPIPSDTEEMLREEIQEREMRELPYPKHHLTLLNDNSVRMDELMCRIEGLVDFIEPNGGYDGIGDC